MIEFLIVAAVVGVGILFVAFKWPAGFGIASKAVGTTTEKAAWAVKDKVEAAVAPTPAPPAPTPPPAA